MACVNEFFFLVFLSSFTKEGVRLQFVIGQFNRKAWTSPRVREMTDSIRDVLNLYRETEYRREPPASNAEVEQALYWASHPKTVTGVRGAVYANKDNSNLRLLQATAVFPINVVTLGNEWKGTLDKLLGFREFLKHVDDDEVILFIDAYDVFGNGFDGHELLRRYFSFGRPIVISTEENIFPREAAGEADGAIGILAHLGYMNSSASSRYLNAGGIIGMGWALKRMYEDMRDKMKASDPSSVQRYADTYGHWFLHAYDQYELWAFFIRHAGEILVSGEEPLVALDTEQLIFGSTVMRKENWPELLGNCTPAEHSIDVDFPMVFDAPLSLFEISHCHARFIGREHFPIFWHGHGPIKTAWMTLRDRLHQGGCFPPGSMD